MPRYKVTRVIHEIAYLDAPTEDDAIDEMAYIPGSEIKDVECPEIFAELEIEELDEVDTVPITLPAHDTPAKLRYLLEEELITAREYEQRMAELE